VEWEVSGEEFEECKELCWNVLWFGKVRCKGEKTTTFTVKWVHVNAVDWCGAATGGIAIGKEAKDERVVDWFIYFVDVTCR
jgi:hypothetical protein